MSKFVWSWQKLHQLSYSPSSLWPGSLCALLFQLSSFSLRKHKHASSFTETPTLPERGHQLPEKTNKQTGRPAFSIALQSVWRKASHGCILSVSPADSDAAESQLLQTRELDERGIIQTYIVSKYRSSESPCEPSINTQAHKCMHARIMTVVLLLPLFAKDTLPFGLWSDEGVWGGIPAMECDTQSWDEEKTDNLDWGTGTELVRTPQGSKAPRNYN